MLGFVFLDYMSIVSMNSIFYAPMKIKNLGVFLDMSLSLTLQSHFTAWWTLGVNLISPVLHWNFLSKCKSDVSSPATSSVLSHCSRTKGHAFTQPQTLPELAASCLRLSLQLSSPSPPSARRASFQFLVSSLGHLLLGCYSSA